MGNAIAQLMALHGIQTTIADVSHDAANAGRERAVSIASVYESQHLFEVGSTELVASRLHAAGSIGEAVAGAEYVLEAVTEDPHVKQDVYEQLGRAEPDAIIATNTSAIPIGELASSIRDPSRFLGTHWFNPPQWVPCVEVIPGQETREQVVDTVVTLLEHLGKWPVRVGDAAGFVANRIQFAMFKEAVAVVEEGIATPAQVDAVVQGSFGFRLPFFGPFLIADMAGLDVYTGAYAALAAHFGPRLEAPSILRTLVDADRLGIKHNGGFFDSANSDLRARVEARDWAFNELKRLVERAIDWRK
jgi:3-hydroxybutyryl-CoA dehydrogenase